VLKIVLNGSQAVYNGTQQNTRAREVYALNLVGGGTTVRGFVISNSGAGIEIASDHNIIEGDYIGTDVTGEYAQGNSIGIRVGIYPTSASANVPGSYNRIGAYGNGVADFADRNILSGNLNSGVQVQWGSSYNVVAGNYIGTDASGTRPLGNNIWG